MIKTILFLIAILWLAWFLHPQDPLPSPTVPVGFGAAETEEPQLPDVKNLPPPTQEEIMVF